MSETYQGYFSPDIEFLIHGWEMTSEITEDGYYQLKKHHLVHFKFEDICEPEISKTDSLRHQ